MRTESEITLLAGLAERGVHVIQIADLADGGLAVEMHLADLAARQLDLCVITVLGTEDRHLSGGTDHSGASARNQFNVVDLNTDRNVAELESIARLDFGFLAGNDGLSDLESVRSEDISLFTIRVGDKRNERGTVRIVFELLNRGCNAVLGALEVDHSVATLVAAPAETGGNPSVIVSAAGGFLAFGKAFFRSCTADFGIVDHGNVTTALCRGIITLDRHSQSPYARSMEPSARETTAFFQLARRPGSGDLPERLGLPL